MIQNRIIELFKEKSSDILNVYCTAGYPQLEDTLPILKALDESGVEMIEIGMPFSDPIADGPTVQASNQQALQNGMSLEILFRQLKDIRQSVSVPLLLMGYLNPIVQMGIEEFCRHAADVGIDGLILPDLPLWEYETHYKSLFDTYQLSNIFLISPQTSEQRIRKIDEITEGFIYMVSMDSTTGRTGEISDKQKAYFDRIQQMNLKNPRLIGFGIHNRETFQTASQYAHGAIIGSAFIKSLKETKNVSEATKDFISSIRSKV